MKLNTLVRRGFVIFIILFCGYLILELGVLVFYPIINGKLLPFRKFDAERAAIIADYPQDREIQGRTKVWGGNVFEVIHPYLGFVRDPSKMEGHCQHGFYGPDPFSQSGSGPDLTIAIFGGSFAEAVAREAADTLSGEFRKSQFFQKKKIKVLTLAMGGYKQPQQLMALTYFLALGAHFDIVINIDGFNEVALPIRENLPKNVFPPYPRDWFTRVMGLSNPQIMLIIGRIAVLQDRRKQWAETFSRFPFKYSAIANLIWKVFDQQIGIKLVKDNLSYQEYRIEEHSENSYLATGPGFSQGNQAEIYHFLTEIWENSSRQMGRICRANGIAYYHFLQPNQYFPGSKPMSAAELQIAFSVDHPYKEPVEFGYPLLIQAGNRLRSEEINFRNLTMLFSDNEEILYADNACHLNSSGYGLIAKEIARFILAAEEKSEEY